MLKIDPGEILSANTAVRATHDVVHSFLDATTTTLYLIEVCAFGLVATAHPVRDGP
jgi:hypothetical protein